MAASAKSGHMCPSLTAKNMADGLLRYAISYRQLPAITLAQSVTRANGLDSVYGQLGTSVTFAPGNTLGMLALPIAIARGITPFCVSIPIVVAKCAQKKMGWIDARFAIATMQYAHMLWDCTMGHFVGNAMR